MIELIEANVFHANKKENFEQKTCDCGFGLSPLPTLALLSLINLLFETIVLVRSVVERKRWHTPFVKQNPP